MVSLSILVFLKTFVSIRHRLQVKVTTIITRHARSKNALRRHWRSSRMKTPYSQAFDARIVLQSSNSNPDPCVQDFSAQSQLWVEHFAFHPPSFPTSFPSGQCALLALRACKREMRRQSADLGRCKKTCSFEIENLKGENAKRQVELWVESRLQAMTEDLLSCFLMSWAHRYFNKHSNNISKEVKTCHFLE